MEKVNRGGERFITNQYQKANDWVCIWGDSNRRVPAVPGLDINFENILDQHNDCPAHIAREVEQFLQTPMPD